CEYWLFDCSRFHAGTAALCGAPGGRALSSAPCEIRQQIALMLTPKDSMIAPTATCAVAISAALLLQITQAPSTIWQKTKVTQSSDRRLRTLKLCASLETRRQNAIIAAAIISAKKRCAICSQI